MSEYESKPNPSSVVGESPSIFISGIVSLSPLQNGRIEIPHLLYNLSNLINVGALPCQKVEGGRGLKKSCFLFILLFILAFTIRFMGGAWETRWDNDAYMARQAEYIYFFGHPAVPDPFSSAPLYQPGMAYLLAIVGWLIDLIPFKFTLSSMVIAEGVIPPLLGAGTVLLIYWFAKSLFNKSAGVVAGLLASFSYFLFFRTMKGFVFHNALSLFSIILTVIAFWKALKTVENPFPVDFKNKAVYLVHRNSMASLGIGAAFILERFAMRIERLRYILTFTPSI